jgi:hypothetical protein
MADRRSGPRAARLGTASEGPHRIAEVLSDVLARYGYDVRPKDAEESSSARLAAGSPIRQLELFSEAGLTATA